MSNYFQNRNKNYGIMQELLLKLEELRQDNKDMRSDYLDKVANLVAERPGLTASQYAALLTNDPDEQYAIATSIGVMGYMAEAARNEKKVCSWSDYSPLVCKKPSIPTLQHKRKIIIRRFIEIDQNNNPIGSMVTERVTHVYSIEDND